MKPCPKCEGGGYDGRACPVCSGLGKHTCVCGDASHTCSACRGGGRILCPICGGSGLVRGRREERYKVGAGLEVEKKPLTRVVSLSYIRRHSRKEESRSESRDIYTRRLSEEERALKYGLKKIDLERASSADAQKYREKLITVLRQCEWNVTHAAKRVGLSRNSVYRRMHLLGIKVPQGERRRRGYSIFDHQIAGVRG